MTEPEPYHRKDHTQCKLKWERNIMFVCVENPRTSRYVMDLMQDPGLGPKVFKATEAGFVAFCGCKHSADETGKCDGTHGSI